MRPTLNTTVYLTYERGNREYEASVDVEFTTDGENIVIKNWTTADANAHHVDTDWFDEMVYDATADKADGVYEDYLADQAEYHAECRSTKEAA